LLSLAPFLNKKEPGLDDFGNSQFIQITKDAISRGFAILKACPQGKAKVRTGQSFAGAWKGSKNQKV
jgi:hypothetical protein